MKKKKEQLDGYVQQLKTMVEVLKKVIDNTMDPPIKRVETLE